jgi:Fis family transcriptional regulator
MNCPSQKKRTEEQLRDLEKLCHEFSLRELVEQKIIQLLNQMETFDGNTCTEGDIYSCIMGTVEESLIKETLNKTKGNKSRTAEILGINRNTLRNKMNGKFK